jgi:hypothetical protein
VDRPGPIGDHPLLRRVRVNIDAALEPDGYRVTIDDVVRQTGRVPIGRRLLPPHALDLLPAEVAAEARTEEQPALQELGDCTIAEPLNPEAFAGLISLSPLEVAVRRLEAVVAAAPAR